MTIGQVVYPFGGDFHVGYSSIGYVTPPQRYEVLFSLFFFYLSHGLYRFSVCVNVEKWLFINAVSSFNLLHRLRFSVCLTIYVYRRGMYVFVAKKITMKDNNTIEK